MSYELLILTASLFGNWAGTGTCHLSHGLSTNTACDYHFQIERKDDALQTQYCIIWHQQWGDGRECQSIQYEIRQDGELWISNSQGTHQAGQLNANAISINYEIPGGKVEELYRLEQDHLVFRGSATTSGMRWDYNVTLSPVQ